MITNVYRYKFREHVDLLEAERTLHLAILAAEGLYGEAHVRMDMAYVIDEAIRVIAIDASTNLGQDVGAIFTTFLLREFGRQAFSVRSVEPVEVQAVEA
jgi:hypothetical protein